MRSVRPESPGDRGPGVEPAAKPIIASLGLRLAHGGMPPHQIRTRVLSPAKINDFVVPQRVGVSGRAWEWSQDAAVDHGEAVFARQVEDLVVAFRRVFFGTQDEKADPADGPPLNLSGVFLLISGLGELFFNPLFGFLVSRLDGHEETDAA